MDPTGRSKQNHTSLVVSNTLLPRRPESAWENMLPPPDPDFFKPSAPTAESLRSLPAVFRAILPVKSSLSGSQLASYAAPYFELFDVVPLGFWLPSGPASFFAVTGGLLPTKSSRSLSLSAAFTLVPSLFFVLAACAIMLASN